MQVFICKSCSVKGSHKGQRSPMSHVIRKNGFRGNLFTFYLKDLYSTLLLLYSILCEQTDMSHDECTQDVHTTLFHPSNLFSNHTNSSVCQRQNTARLVSCVDSAITIWLRGWIKLAPVGSSYFIMLVRPRV